MVRDVEFAHRTPAADIFSVIPVLVTGIQQPRVCAVNDSFQPKDLGWLDSCDKHRNDGGRGKLPMIYPSRGEIGTLRRLPHIAATLLGSPAP